MLTNTKPGLWASLLNKLWGQPKQRRISTQELRRKQRECLAHDDVCKVNEQIDRCKSLKETYCLQPIIAKFRERYGEDDYINHLAKGMRDRLAAKQMDIINKL